MGDDELAEIPPNGQGIVAQMALNIFQHGEAKWQDADTLHQQIEAMKLAYTDGKLALEKGKCSCAIIVAAKKF